MTIIYRPTHAAGDIDYQVFDCIQPTKDCDVKFTTADVARSYYKYKTSMPETARPNLRRHRRRHKTPGCRRVGRCEFVITCRSVCRQRRRGCTPY